MFPPWFTHCTLPVSLKTLKIKKLEHHQTGTRTEEIEEGRRRKMELKDVEDKIIDWLIKKKNQGLVD